MGKFHDAKGNTQEFIVTPETYAQALKQNRTVQQLVDHETGTPGAFAQMAVNAGLNFSAGGYVPTISEVVNGTCMASPGGTNSNSANTNTRSSVPESAILFPAAVLATIENKLVPDTTTIPSLYESRVRHKENIVGTDFRRVVLDYTKPEQARRGKTAQLARPQNMMLLTASDKPGTVPIFSMGLEVADQVVQNSPISLVVLSLQRQMAVQRALDANANILNLLNGNVDTPQAAIPLALRVKASDLDPSLAGKTGELTQFAWLGFFRTNSMIRTIDTIVTDFAGAYAIEQRQNRPVVKDDNNNSGRLDTREKILNPGMPDKVDIIVIEDPDWPAGTIMGFDSNFAIQRVSSLTANYQASAVDTIRRAEAWRFDHGFVDYRLFDDSFTVMTLD